MVRVCPKLCGRLAIAMALFTMGVMQLLTAIILLRSNYASILSGPDFLVASTNISIGCVYGIITNMWNESKKLRPSKQKARRNVRSALLISVITVNITAGLVLVMSEGSQLLHLDTDAKSSYHYSTFVDEVLATAFVTSVCSPIVCVLIAIVALAGNWFPSLSRGSKQHKYNNSISTPDATFGWAYGPKCPLDLKASKSLQASVSSQLGSSSDDSVFPDPSSQCESPQKTKTPKLSWQLKRKMNLPGTQMSRRHTNDSDEDLIPRIKLSSVVRELQERIAESPEHILPCYQNESCGRTCGSQWTSSPNDEIAHEENTVSCVDDLTENVKSELRHVSVLMNGRRSRISTNKNNLMVNSNGPTNCSSDSLINELKRFVLSHNGKTEAVSGPFRQNAIARGIVHDEEFLDDVPLDDDTGHYLEDQSSITKSMNVPSIISRPMRVISIRGNLESDSSVNTNEVTLESDNSTTTLSGDIVLSPLEYSSFTHAEMKGGRPLDILSANPSNQEVERMPGVLCSLGDIDKIPSKTETEDNFDEVQSKYLFAKKKSSMIGSFLKGMWSSVGTEPMPIIKDLIVDADSLIGLSDEELMARISRMRTIGKSVEHCQMNQSTTVTTPEEGL